MKLKTRTERSSSILDDEVEQIAKPEECEESKELTAEERKRLISSLLPIGISLLVLIAVFVVGVIYANVSQKQQPRNSTPTHYALMATATTKANDVTALIEQTYYTKENGLMVTLAFLNDMETEQHINYVVITIRNQDNQLIAQAQSDVIDLMVPADDMGEKVIYIKPEYVSIINDPLETLRYEINIYK